MKVLDIKEYNGLPLLVYVPLAQLDKACDYESQDREFKSLKGYQKTEAAILFAWYLP